MLNEREKGKKVLAKIAHFVFRSIALVSECSFLADCPSMLKMGSGEVGQMMLLLKHHLMMLLPLFAAKLASVSKYKSIYYTHITAIQFCWIFTLNRNFTAFIHHRGANLQAHRNDPVIRKCTNCPFVNTFCTALSSHNFVFEFFLSCQSLLYLAHCSNYW